MIIRRFSEDLFLRAKSDAQFRKFRKAIFLDLDGTLWPDSGVGAILRIKLLRLPFRSELMRLSNNWIRIGVTNQTLLCYQPKFRILLYLKLRLKLSLIMRLRLLDAIYVCIHHSKSNCHLLRRECSNRKPNPGLILLAQQDYSVDLPKSILIGDRVTDMVAAESSGVGSRFLVTNSSSFELNDTNFPFGSSYSFSLISDLKSFLADLS